MDYIKFIGKLFAIAFQKTENGTWYIDPHYKMKLYEKGIKPEMVTDCKINEFDVEAILKHELDKRNIKFIDAKNNLIKFINDLIYAKKDSDMSEIEKQIMEYLEINNRESNELNFMLNNMNGLTFDKKDITDN